ncbi:ABC1-domain-containing protein [Cristinia sonorae]|uniref:ABC1-domain-containing protein n=1 Tax=Cristinia sonorae TaxID=1940300 RepID=A0A8K0V068_9AGAR|nr:ABC1-domain-containing protein [Cristinia sonorae]
MQSLIRNLVRRCSQRPFIYIGRGRLSRFPSERRLQYTTSTPNLDAGSSSRPSRRVNPWLAWPTTIVLFAGASVVAYENYQPFRHTVLAVVRCSRIAEAAVFGAVDYKKTLGQTYESEDARNEALSGCHKRSAERVLKALLANGGIFIKLGQHMASLVVLPVEWSSTMRPLQDQCEPTAYEDMEELIRSDLGGSIDELFSEFDPKPVGVASLAQVHVGRLRSNGRRVAVKLQHPHLAEFCDIDMEMVEVSLGWIKHWFPEFEFTWLADEMRQNLPKEMDFVHEADNTHRAVKDFERIRTSLYIPEVIDARKRILVMEYIVGGRVDDLRYLADHNIDRNKVSLELARTFGQMVHINGWFHADPHPGSLYDILRLLCVAELLHAGNLLIRPASQSSRSPYNFEIVLLDHGLYFDLDDELRVNYSRFWLSLMAAASPQTNADRRRYAKLVGNINDELYPVFEAAITGRAALEGSWDELQEENNKNFKRASSMIDLSAQREAEMEAIRNAVVQHEGLLLSVFDVLRRVPRRVLMVLKLNDLTRSLDHALATTHSSIRVFLITAKYCSTAVWRDDQTRLISQMRTSGLMSFGLLLQYFSCWWRHQKLYRSLVLTETILDTQARIAKMRLWLKGLFIGGGLQRAHDVAAGLAIA